MGAIIRVAKVNRNAAMTSEGASACAKRIKIEAVDTANMAMSRLRRGTIRRFSMSYCNHEYPGITDWDIQGV